MKAHKTHGTDSKFGLSAPRSFLPGLRTDPSVVEGPAEAPRVLENLEPGQGGQDYWGTTVDMMDTRRADIKAATKVPISDPCPLGLPENTDCSSYSQSPILPPAIHPPAPRGYPELI